MGASTSLWGALMLGCPFRVVLNWGWTLLPCLIPPYQPPIGCGPLSERKHDLGHGSTFWPRAVPGLGHKVLAGNYKQHSWQLWKWVLSPGRSSGQCNSESTTVHSLHCTDTPISYNKFLEQLILSLGFWLSLFLEKLIRGRLVRQTADTTAAIDTCNPFFYCLFWIFFTST